MEMVDSGSESVENMVTSQLEQEGIGTGTSILSQLPAETLVCTFEFLKDFKRVQLENVNRCWRRVSRFQSWHSFKMFTVNGESKCFNQMAPAGNAGRDQADQENQAEPRVKRIRLIGADQAEDQADDQQEENDVSSLLERNKNYLETILDRAGPYIEEIHVKNPALFATALENVEFWLRMPRLHTVNLDGNVGGPFRPFMNHQLLTAVSGSVPNLRALFIRHFTRMDPTPQIAHLQMLEALESLFRAHPQMELLWLTMSLARSLKCLPAGLKALQIDCFFQYNNPEYVELTFGNGRRMDGHSLDQLRVQSLVELASRQCPQLEALFLPHCQAPYSVATLALLGSSFTNLRLLRLNSSNCDPSQLEALFHQGHLALLQGLFIDQIQYEPVLDNQVLSTIVHNCPQLQYLDVVFKYELDSPNFGMAKLRELKMLRSLAICARVPMDAAELVRLVKEMPNLESLDIRTRAIQKTMFSLEQLLDVIKACKKLRKLCLNPDLTCLDTNPYETIADCVHEAKKGQLSKKRTNFQLKFYVPELMSREERKQILNVWQPKGVDFLFDFFPRRDADNHVLVGLYQSVAQMPRNVRIIGN